MRRLRKYRKINVSRKTKSNNQQQKIIENFLHNTKSFVHLRYETNENIQGVGVGMGDYYPCRLHQCRCRYNQILNMNKVIIIGNVGKEPNITTFANGGKAAQFSVADSQKAYTTKSGVQIPAHTEWFNVCAKGNTAEIVEKYVHKGDKLFIEGHQNTRQYTDKDNNQKTFTEIVIERLEMLGSKPQQSTMEQQTTVLFGEPKQVTPTQQPQDGEINGEDLPF